MSTKRKICGIAAAIGVSGTLVIGSAGLSSAETAEAGDAPGQTGIAADYAPPPPPADAPPPPPPPENAPPPPPEDAPPPPPPPENVPPPEQEPPPPPPPPEPAPPPVTFLEDMDKIEGGSNVNTGPRDVADRTFEHTISMDRSWSTTTTRTVEYDLGQEQNHFSAEVGLDTESNSDGEATFNVYVDDAKRDSVHTGIGEVTPIEVDVAGAQRLKLEVVPDTDTKEFGAVWGGARLLG